MKLPKMSREIGTDAACPASISTVVTAALSSRAYVKRLEVDMVVELERALLATRMGVAAALGAEARSPRTRGAMRRKAASRPKRRAETLTPGSLLRAGGRPPTRFRSRLGAESAAGDSLSCPQSRRYRTPRQGLVEALAQHPTCLRRAEPRYEASGPVVRTAKTRIYTALWRDAGKPDNHRRRVVRPPAWVPRLCELRREEDRSRRGSPRSSGHVPAYRHTRGTPCSLATYSTDSTVQ